MLPNGNILLTHNYDVKKILCPMGMEYIRIHACSNDFILYSEEFDNLHECPQCGVSQKKNEKR
uniref:Uncharacterized protein n=1 Tax=Cajanus cajan TaxID=3821 RepID=A0A151UD54_CAJCA